MWFLRKASFLLSILCLTACTPSAVVVEMAVTPATATVAKIKQLAGKTNAQTPTNCQLPCSVTVDTDSNYEVTLDAPGYYPVIVQFDWIMAYNTSRSLDLSKSTNGMFRTPLIIPLLQRKVVKDKVVEDNLQTPAQ